MAFCTLVFVLLSLPLFFGPMFVDTWVFAYIGKHMSLDKLPYLDLPDNKGIFTYLFYRGLDFFFPQNFFAWNAVFLLLALASAGCIWLIVKKKAGEEAALAAFAFYLALSLFPGIDTFGSSEAIGMPFLLASFALLYYNSKSARAQIAAGLLFSIPLLTNILFLPSLISLALFHFLGEFRLSRQFAIPAAFLPLVFLLFLASTGSLPAFVEWFFTYNLAHSGAYYEDTPQSIIPLAGLLNVPLHILLALVLAVFYFPQLRKFRILALCIAPLLLFTVSKILLIVVPDHYSIATLPLYAISAGAVFSSFRGFDGTMVRALLLSSLAFLSLAFLSQNLGSAETFPQHADLLYQQKFQSAYPAFQNSPNLLAVGQGLAFTRAYYLANSTYSGKYFFYFHIFSKVPFLRKEMDNDVLSAMANGSAKLIVTDADCPNIFCPTAEVSAGIASGYTCNRTDFGMGGEYNYSYCVRNA